MSALLYDHNAPRALAALTPVFATLAQAGCMDLVAFGMGVAELEQGRTPALVNVWARHMVPDRGAALTTLSGGREIHTHRATPQIVRNDQPRILMAVAGQEIVLELYGAPDPQILDHLAVRPLIGGYQIALAPHGHARVSAAYRAALRSALAADNI